MMTLHSPLHGRARGSTAVGQSEAEFEERIVHVEGDVGGLFGHLATLARNPDLITSMGGAGRDLVERKFDASKLGLKLAAIYGGIL